MPAAPEARPADTHRARNRRRRHYRSPQVAAAAADPCVRGPTGTIGQLAMTDDGGAVLSVDVTGNLRLWPTLDGRVEPLAVAAPAPIAIALTREGRLRDCGRRPPGRTHDRPRRGQRDQVSRAQISGDNAYVDVRATSLGFIAARADHVIDGIDLHAHGSARSSCPWRRIAAVLSRGGRRPLVLVQSATAVRGRWIASQ